MKVNCSGQFTAKKFDSDSGRLDTVRAFFRGRQALGNPEFGVGWM
jgi:hypothetical protein